MNNKRKKLIEIVWNDFNDCENFDKINYMFFKCYDLFLKDTNINFSTFSVHQQYGIILLSMNISVASKRSVLNDFTLFTKKNKDKHTKEYDIEFGYTEPEYINITLINGKTKLIEII